MPMTRKHTSIPASMKIAIAVYIGLSAIVLTPIFCVEVPCLGDYINHLARISVMTRLSQSPILQNFYQEKWNVVPYYGMDVPMMFFTRFLPIFVAGKIFVGICILMPVAAAATLHYVVHRRLSLIPSAAFLFSYSYVLSRGFLNYSFSSGLAVMLFAGWIATCRWAPWRRLLVFSVLTTVLYMSHVFGFIGYGILVFGYEVGATARWALKPVDRVSGRFVVAGAQALPALFLGLYFRMSNIAGATNTTIFGSVPEKFSALLSPLLFPGTWWVVGLVVLSPVAGLALFRRLRFAPSIWPALLVTLAIALCTPHILFNLWGADLRIPMILATATIGSISFRHEHDYAWKTMFLALLVIVVSIRSSDVFLMLRQLDRQVASVRATLNGLPEGARLLVVDVGPDAAGRRAPAEMTGHLGLLAAIDRDAFVPFLFTGVTPVELTPSYNGFVSLNPMAVTLAQLRSSADDDVSADQQYGLGQTKYWLGWPSKFDDVLIVHFGEVLTDLPKPLELIAVGSVANLYRVKPP